MNPNLLKVFSGDLQGARNQRGYSGPVNVVDIDIGFRRDDVTSIGDNHRALSADRTSKNVAGLGISTAGMGYDPTAFNLPDGDNDVTLI